MIHKSKFMFMSSVLVAAVSFGSNASAETFKYVERDHSAVAGSECDDFAFERSQKLLENIGTRFGQVSIKSAYCMTELGLTGNSNWNVEIVYEASQRLPMISTQDSMPLETIEHKTQEQCQATIVNEVDVFTRKTSLPVFAAYCKAPSFQGGHWYSIVNGFGESENRPYTVNTHLYGTILGHSRETFFSMLTDNLNLRGKEVSQIAVNNRLAYMTLVIRYYGSEKIRLDETEIARFTEEQHCTANLEAARGALTEAGVSTLGTYCYRSTMANGGFGIVTLTDTEGQLVLAKPSRIYEKFEECETQRPAVVDHYRGSLNRDIKGSFCTKDPESKKFKVVMIEKRV